jgi:hypothetical protein
VAAVVVQVAGTVVAALEEAVIAGVVACKSPANNKTSLLNSGGNYIFALRQKLTHRGIFAHQIINKTGYGIPGRIKVQQRSRVD